MGNSDSRSAGKRTWVNDEENDAESSNKTKQQRTNSNPQSPEIANEFGSNGNEHQLEVKMESSGGSTTSPKNVAMETNTQADEDAREKIIAKLEARQNEVIKKLMHLRDMLNNVNGATSTAVGGNVQAQLTESVEAVIHAHPYNPPLSLFFLAKLLRKSYGPCHVNLKPYRHSSMRDERMPSLAQLLNQPAEESSTDAGNMIDIFVIWKKVRVPEGEEQLPVQPFLQAPIHIDGEANIAVYFSRLLPAGHPLNYDTLSTDDVIRVDRLLKNAIPGVDFAQLEKQLEAHGPCLLGEATLADFVYFSIVFADIQRNTAKIHEYPRLFKWFKGYPMWPGMRPATQQSQIGPSAMASNAEAAGSSRK